MSELIQYPSARIQVHAGPKPSGINILDIHRHRITDSTGVPLSSDRASAKLTRGIDWQYQSCPFHDSPSRFPNGEPHPIPMSGLERQRLSTHYREVVSIGVQIRRDLFSHSNPLTPIELRGLLRGLQYLPHYMHWRSQDSIPQQGVLPPAMIILSNSAAGASGALEGYLEDHNQSPTLLGRGLHTEADTERIVASAEKRGIMIGDKTVCVASPELMKHFIAGMVSGNDRNLSQFDLSRWLSGQTEVGALSVFGQHAYTASVEVEILAMLDADTFNYVKPKLLGNHLPKRFRRLVDDFLAISQKTLGNLQAHQHMINIALQRQPSGPALTLDMLSQEGLEMPGLIKQLR